MSPREWSLNDDIDLIEGTADLLDTSYHRRRVARRRAGRDTAWLIERGQPEGFSQPVWYGSYAAGGKWTTDANKAVRFASKAEADLFIERHLTPIGIAARATEHGWVPAVTETADLRVRTALDRAWLASGDARGHARPADLGDHLVAALAPAVTETADLRAALGDAEADTRRHIARIIDLETVIRAYLTEACPGPSSCGRPHCDALRAALAGTSDTEEGS